MSKRTKKVIYNYRDEDCENGLIKLLKRYHLERDCAMLLVYNEKTKHYGIMKERNFLGEENPEGYEKTRCDWQPHRNLGYAIDAFTNVINHQLRRLSSDW